MFANLPQEAIQSSLMQWEKLKMAQEDFDTPDEESELSDLNADDSPPSRRQKMSRTVQTENGIVQLRVLKKDLQKQAYRLAKRKDARTEPDPKERMLQSFIDDIGAAILPRVVARERGDNGRFTLGTGASVASQMHSDGRTRG